MWLLTLEGYNKIEEIDQIVFSVTQKFNEVLSRILVQAQIFYPIDFFTEIYVVDLMPDLLMLYKIQKKLLIDQKCELWIMELEFIYETPLPAFCISRKSSTVSDDFMRKLLIDMLAERDNRKNDLAKIFNCNQGEVRSPTLDDWLENFWDCVCYDWDILLNNLSTSWWRLPKYVTWRVVIDNYINKLDFTVIWDLRRAKKLVLIWIRENEILDFRKYIWSLYIDHWLKSGEWLIFPPKFVWDIVIKWIWASKWLKLPESSAFGINLDCQNLTDTEWLELPKDFCFSLSLPNLRCASWMRFPKIIATDLNLWWLNTTSWLELSEEVWGKVILTSLPEDEIEEVRYKYPKLNIKGK